MSSPKNGTSSIWEIKERTRNVGKVIFPPHNYNEDDLNRAVITIPVTTEQKRKIDSMASAYLRKTPYDYAVAGMRCASASYDIMARAGLFKEYGSSTWWKDHYANGTHEHSCLKSPLAGRKRLAGNALHRLQAKGLGTRS